MKQDDLNAEDKINRFKAIGEDSSAKILNAYLNELGIDAQYISPKDAGIIVEKTPTGTKVLSESYSLINKLDRLNRIAVIPRFFAYTKTRSLETFSRGGSDIT